MSETKELKEAELEKVLGGAEHVGDCYSFQRGEKIYCNREETKYY